jgi:hypothetical protein
MDYIFNKYILAVGSIMTPLIAVIMNHLQDSFYMFFALISLVTVDTFLGMYIAIKEGKFKSGRGGFWRIGDKLTCYFGLLMMIYTIVFLANLVPFFATGVTPEALKYMIMFTFSVMYGRETLSIFESIDRLQPKLVPSALRRQINKVFNKNLEETNKTY